MKDSKVYRANNGTVLIVDDNTNNLKVLEKMLEHEGYKVHLSRNGRVALKSIRIDPPDIILLDVHMPDMDGYKVCKIIKSEKNSKDIPIIFLSVLTGTFNKIQAFKIGGVDYITKPFEPTEVLARIKVHVELKKSRDEFKKRNMILNKMGKICGDLEEVTRHDLRGPLSGILGYPALIKQGRNLLPEQLDFLDSIEKLGKKMLNMINLSLRVSNLERILDKDIKDPVDVLPIIKDLIKELDMNIREKKLTIKVLVDSDNNKNDKFIIIGVKSLFESMFVNLIKNAIEASPTKKKITINLKKNKNKQTISIHNFGEIPKQIRSRFFDKYITSGKEFGIGLGTYLIRLIVESHNGNINFTTSKDKGTTININFTDE